MPKGHASAANPPQPSVGAPGCDALGFTGPMLRGSWRGKTLGSGTDVWKYWAELKAGNIDEAAWAENRRADILYKAPDGRGEF